MTIAIRAAGTPTATTQPTNFINPTPPAGWQSGDLSLMYVAIRDATAGIPTSISGWTHLFTTSGGSGTFANDTGTSRIAVFYRFDSPVAPGNIAFTSVPASSSAGAVIHIYQKSAGYDWDLSSFTSVADNTQSSNYQATVGGSDLNLAAGDLLAFCEIFSSDGGTVAGETITVTGCTMGALTIRGERAISVGFDCRLRPGDVPVLSGTSSAAPVHAYTNLQGGTGVTAMVRLREVASVITGTGASTLAGVTASGVGTETISGSAVSALEDVTSAATGTEDIPGAGSSTLTGVTASGSGTETVSGAGTSTLDGATLVASGAEAISGTGAPTLDGAALVASGSESIAGSATSTLDGATLVASGAEAITGAASSTLEGAILEATGVIGDLEPIGIGASTLDGATLSATGSLSILGSADSTLEGAHSSSYGSLAISGYGATTLDGCTLVASDAVFYPSPERISGVKSQSRVSKAQVTERASKSPATERSSRVPTSTRTSTVRR